MTPKEVLIQAKNLIKNEGWCQGSFAKSADGGKVASRDLLAKSYCAVGALNAWGGLNREDNLIRSDARAFLERLVGVITTWNDQPGRTKEEVLQKFQEAIDLAAKSE